MSIMTTILRGRGNVNIECCHFPPTPLVQKGGWQREKEGLQKGSFHTGVGNRGESTKGVKIGVRHPGATTSPLEVHPLHPHRVSHHISLCSTFAGFDPIPFFYWCYYIPNFNFKIQWLIFYIPHGLWKSTEFGSTKCLENVSHPFSPVPLKSLLKVLPPEPIAEVRHRSLQSCRQAMEHTAKRREEKHACHSTGVKSGTLFFNFSAFSYLKSQIINDDFKRYLGKLNHMYISSAK